MSTITLCGSDVIKINDRILNDFADGDNVTLTFPNDLSAIKTGKNGNSIYSFNHSGMQCEVEMRICRGTADDKFLNNLLSLYKNNPAAFSLLTGEFIKNLGDGSGNILADTYILSGGVFQKNVDVVENAEGDTNQAVAVYTFLFSNAPRSIS